ncbi:hypothetical protein FQZ97_945290 [compost metagenome]
MARGVEVQHSGLAGLVGGGVLLAAGGERQGAQGDGGEGDEATAHAALLMTTGLAVAVLRMFLNGWTAGATSRRSAQQPQNQAVIPTTSRASSASSPRALA